MGKIKLIAMLMVSLIISLPIYSSIAIAALDIRNVYGEDLYENYVKDGDRLYIEVFASDGGNAVENRSLVKYGGAPTGDNKMSSSKGISFDSCMNGTCTIEFNWGEYTLSPNPDTVKIYSYACNDPGCALTGSDSEELVLDEKDPDIALTSSNTKIGYGGLGINYSANDYACNGVACNNKCSGINRIEFYSSQIGLVKTVYINSEPGECSVKNYENFTTTEISNQEGNLDIYSIVYDNMGSSFTSNILTFVVDLSSPDIDVNSFTITDELGGNATLVPISMYTVSMSIQITDPDLQLDNITLDLSVLNSNLGVTKSDSCTSNGDVHTCYWDDVQLDLSADTTVSLVFTAIDNVGNVGTATVSHYFDVDTSVPYVGGIKTDKLVDGEYYLGADDVVFLEIGDSGVGFNSGEVYMDLSRVRTGSNNQQADNCTNNGGWTCYFSVDPNKEGKKMVKVKTSYDDYGKELNLSLSEQEKEIIVDITNPVITNVAYSPTTPTSEDTLIVTFDVEEANGFYAYVNASAFSNTGSIAATCGNSTNSTASGNTGNIISCTADVTGLATSHTIADFVVTAIDYSGNEADSVTDSVTIYYLESTTAPNCFSVSSVSTVPSQIDRAIASQISMNVFAEVSLSSICSDVTMTDMNVDCSAMSSFLSETAYLMNSPSLSPFIALKTSSTTSYGNSSNSSGSGSGFNIDCTLSITQVSSTTVYSISEQEQVTSSVTMYGNALGTIDAATQAKIDDINDEIDAVDDKIDTYEQIVDIWGTWCQISEALGLLNSALQAVKSVLYGVLSALWFACYGVAAACLVGYAACLLSCQTAVNSGWAALCEGLSIPHSHIVEKFIWPSGYISPFVIGLLNKYACMIGFHCAICDADFWTNLAISGIVAGASAYQNSNTVSFDQHVENEVIPSIQEMDIEQVDTFEGVGTGGPVSTGPPGAESVAPTTSTTTTSAVPPSTPMESNTPTPTVPAANIQPVSNTLPDPAPPATLETGPSGTGGGGSTLPSGTIEGVDPSPEIEDTDIVAAAVAITSREELETLEGVKSSSNKQGLSEITGNTVSVPNKQLNNGYGDWLQAGEQTASPSGYGNWIFNPYKSIHYAHACLCLPAYVYNYKKDKQIKCMYRNCLQNHGTNGLSTTSCDVAYKERQCLYIESAQYKEQGGDLGTALENLMDAILENWALLVASLAYLGFCWTYIMSPEVFCTKALVGQTPFTGWYPATCGLVGAAITVNEIIGVFESEFSFLNYGQDLEGEDYCSTGNT